MILQSLILGLFMSNVLVGRVKGIRDLLETGLFRQLVFIQTEDHLVVFAVIKTIVGYPCEIPYKILKDIHLKQKSPGTTKRKSNKVML